jgi:hypothetical protein
LIKKHSSDSGKLIVKKNGTHVVKWQKTWLIKKYSMSFVLAAKSFAGEGSSGNGKPSNGQGNHNLHDVKCH